MLSSTRALAVLALATAPLAQVTLHSDGYASSGPGTYKNVVRDDAGTLWCLSLQETDVPERELRLRSSTDGGITWTLDPMVLNDASSGLTGSEPATHCSFALAPTGRMHITWGRYHEVPTAAYNKYYQQYYRRYDPATGVADPIVDVSTLCQATNANKTNANSIAVDASNFVWMVGHGDEKQEDYLLRSFLPGAQSGFANLGKLCEQPGFSSRYARLCVDANGVVHATYFRNVGKAQYEHRAYDPSTGSWGGNTVLGDSILPQDYYGSVCADALGNVHALIAMDSSPTSNLWKLRYRRWNAASGWGFMTKVADFTLAQHSGVADVVTMAIACDEATGMVFAIYRDLSTPGGDLRFATKGLNDLGFTAQPAFEQGTGAEHELRWPTVRGTLYPPANYTGSILDLTWQHRPNLDTPPFSLQFARIPAAGDLSGSPGTTSITAGGYQDLALDAGTSHAGGTYLMLGSVSGTSPGFPVDGMMLPLNIDSYFFHLLYNPNGQPLAGSLGTLDGAGRAAATFTLPPGVLSPIWAGYGLNHAYMVFDLVQVKAVYVSQPAKVTLTP